MRQVKDVEGCNGCPLQKLFPMNNFVAPFLVPNSTRLCVAEAPGELEAERGEPLVGTSGSWLFGKEVDGKRSGGLYRAAGVDTATISKCNVLNCRPPDNVFPTDAAARAYISKEEGEAAVAQCLKNHVIPVLKDRKWKRIDIFGSKSLEALCGVTGGIMRWRGSPLPIPELGPVPICIPTVHPAALARDQSLMPAVVSDLKKSLDTPPEYYNLEPSLEDVRAFTATEFAFDIETRMDTQEITMVGLCDRPYHAMCVPFAGAYKAELKRIFENAKVLYTQNGIAFDIPRLFPQLGLEWRPEY